MKTNGKLASRRPPKSTSSSSRSPKGMLESIEVRRFRGFRQVLVDGLSPVTIVTGKNGCGKSTLLEAILALYGRTNPVWVPNLQAHRGFAKFKPALGPNYLGLFHDYRETGSAEISGKFGGGASFKLVIERSSSGTQEIDTTSLTSTDSEQLELVCKAFGRGKLYHTSSLGWSRNASGFPQPIVKNARTPEKVALLLHPSEHVPGEEFAERYNDARKGGGSDRIVRGMRILHEGIEDIEFLKTSTGEYFAAKIGPERRPLGLLGGGLNNLFRFLVALNDTHGGLVAIDEIENGIHYSALPNVLGALVDCALQDGTQLVLSTHSAEALDAIGKAFEKRNESSLSVVHLERVEEDSVRSSVFQGRDAVSSLRLGYELR